VKVVRILVIYSVCVSLISRPWAWLGVASEITVNDVGMSAPAAISTTITLRISTLSFGALMIMTVLMMNIIKS
ncbi:MAG: hypothetical protein O7C56_06800, partial [Rickettsia endosymbiont of Ixodes persulcatus]|nr:hypothetical protein [Rickettsia endosymbiont of Ixodes persulcatus]